MKNESKQNSYARKACFQFIMASQFVRCFIQTIQKSYCFAAWAVVRMRHLILMRKILEKWENVDPAIKQWNSADIIVHLVIAFRISGKLRRERKIFTGNFWIINISCWADVRLMKMCRNEVTRRIGLLAPIMQIYSLWAKKATGNQIPLENASSPVPSFCYAWNRV